MGPQSGQKHSVWHFGNVCRTWLLYFSLDWITSHASGLH